MNSKAILSISIYLLYWGSPFAYPVPVLSTHWVVVYKWNKPWVNLSPGHRPWPSPPQNEWKVCTSGNHSCITWHYLFRPKDFSNLSGILCRTSKRGTGRFQIEILNFCIPGPPPPNPHSKSYGMLYFNCCIWLCLTTCYSEYLSSYSMQSLFLQYCTINMPPLFPLFKR